MELTAFRYGLDNLFCLVGQQDGAQGLTYLRTFPLPYCASLSCCEQRQHSAHSCATPGFPIGECRGNLMCICLMWA